MADDSDPTLGHLIFQGGTITSHGPIGIVANANETTTPIAALSATYETDQIIAVQFGSVFDDGGLFVLSVLTGLTFSGSLLLPLTCEQIVP